jgi:hypothetical protein
MRHQQQQYSRSIFTTANTNTACSSISQPRCKSTVVRLTRTPAGKTCGPMLVNSPPIDPHSSPITKIGAAQVAAREPVWHHSSTGMTTAALITVTPRNVHTAAAAKPQKQVPVSMVRKASSACCV